MNQSMSPLGRAALVLAPLLVLAGHLTQVSPTAHDTSSELSSIAAATGRYQLAGLIGFASAVLFLPALLAMTGLLRPSRPRWAAVGGALSLTGLLALVSLEGSGPVSQALAESSDRAAAIAVTDAYEGLPLTNLWVVLMLLGYVVGPVVLGIGLWRAGASWGVPVLLVAGLLVQMADLGRWPLALGFLLTTAGFAACATRLGAPRSSAAVPEPVAVA
jgi:hypothetical protein